MANYAIVDMNSMCDALWSRLFEKLDEAQHMSNKQGWVSLAAAKKTAKKAHG